MFAGSSDERALLDSLKDGGLDLLAIVHIRNPGVRMSSHSVLFSLTATTLLATLFTACQPTPESSDAPQQVARLIVTEEYSVKQSPDGRTVADTLQVRKSERFDEAGRVVERRYQVQDGSGEETLIQRYDAEGVLRAGGLYVANGRLAVRYEYDTDARGYKTEERSFSPDSTRLGTTVFENDPDGNPTEFYFVSAEGERQGTYYATFDERGLMTSSTFVEPDGASIGATRFEYLLFDDAGNWTVRHASFAGKLVRIDRRRLTYYE